jgi:hypothetical protein
MTVKEILKNDLEVDNKKIYKPNSLQSKKREAIKTILAELDSKNKEIAELKYYININKEYIPDIIKDDITIKICKCGERHYFKTARRTNK